MRVRFRPPSIVASSCCTLALIAAAGIAHAGILTYETLVTLDFPDDSVRVGGTFAIDTVAADQLSQTNAGRFALDSWDVHLKVNGVPLLTFVTGSSSASLSQGINPTLLIFTDGSGNQVGLTIDFAGADPNVAPSIPDGTTVSRGFVEGDVPTEINDQVVPTVGGSVLRVLPGLPFCPDPGIDDDGFAACPCPACMAPCQFPAEPQGECKGPDGSVSATSFACCCCGGSENSFRGFTPTLGLGDAPGGWMLVWTDTPGFDAFDVVGGDLGALRALGGSFAAATSACTADDRATTSVYVNGTPAPGDCVWYLIRGDGGGSYDAASGSQLAPRDSGIAASGNDCQQ